MMNDDILFNIFQFLSYRKLKSISLLSKQFYRIIIRNDLLNKMYNQPKRLIVHSIGNSVLFPIKVSFMAFLELVIDVDVLIF